MDYLIHIDRYLFTLINQEGSNSFFDWLLPIWRNKLTWIPLYIFILVLIYRKYGTRTFTYLFIIGITILFADQISSEWIKKSIERLRPCRDTTMEQVRTLVHCGGGYSFTSSHATNHFALAMQLFLLFRNDFPKWYFGFLFFWAGLIAYSQVYVGVHFPLDVVAGGLLGCSISAIIYFIYRKTKFSKA